MYKKNILICILLLSVLSGCSQPASKKIDSLEFQVGYPNLKNNALEQLKNYPSARYKANHSFYRIYNWMSPYYAGGAGQEGISIPDALKKGADIQEELGVNWNYSLVISNVAPQKAFIDLANKHPEIPLGVTTFWMQTNPNVFRKTLPELSYLKYARINKTVRVVSYAAPDSLFIQDGKAQKKQLQKLINQLSRPINIINENGEEPPKAYPESIVKNDSLLIYDKNKLKIDSWPVYIATKKKHMRQLYSSQFMDSIPELKNTAFTFYQVEGGPIDRYHWHESKATNTKINGNYYSTPDLYPRVPDNWKNWKGAWHGWKWINDGRKVEIKDGDRFFSPFVAAGWSNNPETDMRPAQWLGLLKCATVIGAEFFYTGYFNLGKPVSKPENYIWQAAMPAYAQAVATHYSDIFRNGNVLFDKNENPIVTYPVNDDDVLVTVRKHDQKQVYVIAATVQPSSNTKQFPLQKNIDIAIDGERITINARRQGSVYIFDKTVTPNIFYQLDRWQQYEHPSRWRKDLIYEAEVFDTSSINIQIQSDYKTENNNMDFSNAESHIALNEKQWAGYTIYSRDIEHLGNSIYVMVYAKSKSSITGELIINDWKKKFTSSKDDKYNWIKIEVPKDVFLKNKSSLLQLHSLSQNFEVDKLVVTDSDKVPDLKGY